ncbi:hypothetical protein [Rhizomonospora bruguierae]|uniref:hypothetical protein n=1 Tax=Rhizomonospora bruguierae TaxID=1581705 RepID=UPI001BCBB803|nr:hypothetical protein [Micromonospora sp. NBRC 107566]
MTVIKLDTKPATNAALALERHAQRLYARPGVRIVGVCELAHVERTQPAPDEDKEPTVKLRVVHLEVANPEQEDSLRQAMEALYLHRSAQGTLGEDGDIELSERTIKLTSGLLHAVEAARRRTAVAHWASYARRALGVPNLATSEIRHELDAVATGLEMVLSPDGGESGEG